MRGSISLINQITLIHFVAVKIEKGQKRNQTFLQLHLEIYYPTFIEDLEDMTLNVYLAKL
jgi:hypothetical protein